MGFLDLCAGGDACELGHQTVHHVGVVVGLVCLRRVEQSQFEQLGVGYEVEAEEVGTCLLDGRPVCLERVGVCARHQAAGAVAEAFVQVGVQLVGHVAVGFDAGKLRFVDDKLFQQPAACCGAGVGVGDVAYGDRLGAVGGTYPVGVGQVDAYCGGGVEVSAEDCRVDDFRAHALDDGFPELRVNGRVVLKPLGVAADCLGAGGGGGVFVIDQRFPAGFVAERVAVGLDEAVDEIHRRGCVAEPCYRVVVEHPQVARGVEGDEQLYRPPLSVSLGVLLGTVEPFHDVLDRLAVFAADAPHVLDQPTVALDERGVKPHHRGMVSKRGFLCGIELFRLMLRHSVTVVVAGR